MKERSLTIPEIGMIAGTRAALGIGVGLLFAGKLNDSKRQGAGWALLAVGLLTTIPIIMTVFGRKNSLTETAERLADVRV